MQWFVTKLARRIIRKIGLAIGAISPYDFYDWKVPWVSSKEICKDKQLYINLNKDNEFILDSKNDRIVSHLRYINTEHGINYIPTYVRDLWNVKQVWKHKPTCHYDCGSSFSGFITPLIPLGIQIVLIDIRNLADRFNTSLFKDINGGGGISCLQSDITNLNEIEDNSIESLSIIGAFDSFGLGIYGEPINPCAWRLALLSAQRVLKKGGRFYLTAQTGKQNILHFNAGRVFTLDLICNTLSEMKLDELHFIKNNQLDTYPCLYKNNEEILANNGNIEYLRSQDSVTTLMVFQKS